MTTSEQIALFKLQRDALEDRIEALQKLVQHFPTDREELDLAIEQKTVLQSQIRHAEDALELQQQLARDYEQTLPVLPSTDAEPAASVTLDNAWLADANVVRHALQMQQLELHEAANRAAIQAQRDYLIERLARVQRMPESARQPKELDHLRHKVQEVEQQLAMVDRKLLLLGCEQQRFPRQVNMHHNKLHHNKLHHNDAIRISSSRPKMVNSSLERNLNSEKR